MSTYAVFGMTESLAYAKAKKRTPSVVKGVVIREAEWMEAVAAKAKAIMAGSGVQIVSPAYDAPQFANEFIALARRAGASRDLEVRAKQVVSDAEGKPVINPRTKKPKKAWLPVAGVGA